MAFIKNCGFKHPGNWSPQLVRRPPQRMLRDIDDGVRTTCVEPLSCFAGSRTDRQISQLAPPFLAFREKPSGPSYPGLRNSPWAYVCDGESIRNLRSVFWSSNATGYDDFVHVFSTTFERPVWAASSITRRTGWDTKDRKLLNAIADCGIRCDDEL
jgi:hypothetical protein